MNITSQNRHGQECCSQGEKSWRDRKSPGKASNERSQAALISDISDPEPRGLGRVEGEIK